MANTIELMLLIHRTVVCCIIRDVYGIMVSDCGIR